MKDFITISGQELLHYNGLDCFESLWNLEADWFEPPNQRRGGWSGVSRVVLKCPQGGQEVVFLKRQENHMRRVLQHPLVGEPTFAGEMRNILDLHSLNIPTLDLMYYAQRNVIGNSDAWRAVLITRELDGFRSLSDLMEQWHEQGWGEFSSQRRKVLNELARITSKMHRNRLVHNALYPKHVFVRFGDKGDPEVCLIDLEKMRHTFSFRQACMRDLDSLNRRLGVWSNTDRLRFLCGYLGLNPLNAKGRKLWRFLARNGSKFKSKRLSSVD